MNSEIQSKTLSLSLIVKNEERNLKRFLPCIVDVVDEIIIIPEIDITKDDIYIEFEAKKNPRR